MGFVQPVIWIFAWGFVGASIVVAATASEPVTLSGRLLQFVGSFYLGTVSTLGEFAELTAIRPRWTDIGYAVLAIVPISLHSVFTGLAWYPKERSEYPGETAVGALSVSLVIGLVLVLGASVLGVGAQLLTVSIVGVGVGLAVLGLDVVRVGLQ